jgi:hypothetical protein
MRKAGRLVGATLGLLSALAIGCSSPKSAQPLGKDWDLGGGTGTVVLLFPSGGCPCRYAPLAEELSLAQKKGNPALAAYLASSPPSREEGSVGLPFRWDAGVREIGARYVTGQEDLPFLVVVRTGKRPSLRMAAKVPLVPASQRAMAALVLSLADEKGEP